MRRIPHGAARTGTRFLLRRGAERARTVPLLLPLGLILLPLAACWMEPTDREHTRAAVAISGLQTRAEATSFQETTRYGEVVDFMERVAAVSSRIHLTTFGYSMEGRPLPMAVVGSVPDAKAETVRASGKVRVYIQGGIHAGEICGKEALLVLLRSFALGEYPEWSDSLVLLIAPVYNPDGNERVGLTNRRGQHGPVGGMGRRSNAQGLDLNRDHMKLDSPEARSLARMMTDYDPHILIDLHTTNGTRHAYHLTYSPPLHPNTHPGIDEFLRDELFPAVTETIREERGWESYHYGNAGTPPGGERAWYTFDHRPRFNNNYIGLRNRIGILSEAYAYATFEERILASLYFVEEILAFVAARPDGVRRVVADAEVEALEGSSLALRARPKRSEEPVDFLMGEVREERNPHTGHRMFRRTEARRVERMFEYGSFEATESERVPAYYLIPAELTAVVERLKAHGIEMTPLGTPSTREVEEFRITSTSTEERSYQGHNQRTIEGAYRRVRREAPVGTWVALTNQPLGRLLFSLLEPRSDDGFANWNLLDSEIEGKRVYPILRGFGSDG